MATTRVTLTAPVELDPFGLPINPADLAVADQPDYPADGTCDTCGLTLTYGEMHAICDEYERQIGEVL